MFCLFVDLGSPLSDAYEQDWFSFKCLSVSSCMLFLMTRWQRSRLYMWLLFCLLAKLDSHQVAVDGKNFSFEFPCCSCINTAGGFPHWIQKCETNGACRKLHCFQLLLIRNEYLKRGHDPCSSIFRKEYFPRKDETWKVKYANEIRAKQFDLY